MLKGDVSVLLSSFGLIGYHGGAFTHIGGLMCCGLCFLGCCVVRPGSSCLCCLTSGLGWHIFAYYDEEEVSYA